MLICLAKLALRLADFDEVRSGLNTGEAHQRHAPREISSKTTGSTPHSSFRDRTAPPNTRADHHFEAWLGGEVYLPKITAYWMQRCCIQGNLKRADLLWACKPLPRIHWTSAEPVPV
jgi:hypothetical protein